MSQTVGGVTLDTRELDRIARGLNMNTERVLASVAFEVEGGAKQSAPVDTGALKNSIRTRRINKDLYYVEDGVLYGIYQELGTSRMSKQPFMVPAIERVRKMLADKYKAIFK